MRACPECAAPLRCTDSRGTHALLEGKRVPATRRRYTCSGEPKHRHSSIELFVEMRRGIVLEFNSPPSPFEKLLGPELTAALRARLAK